MEIQILIGYLLSMTPLVELRGGLPVIVEYAVRNNVSIWPHLFIVILLNSITTIFILLFLDLFHDKFKGNRYYIRFITPHLDKIRKKSVKFEKKFDGMGFVALVLFVGIPLPGTGTWTGSVIAWTLGLNRIKSIISITAGVIIAAFLVLLMSLGLFGSLYSIY